MESSGFQRSHLPLADVPWPWHLQASWVLHWNLGFFFTTSVRGFSKHSSRELNPETHCLTLVAVVWNGGERLPGFLYNTSFLLAKPGSREWCCHVLLSSQDGDWSLGTKTIVLSVQSYSAICIACLLTLLHFVLHFAVQLFFRQELLKLHSQIRLSLFK